jgi:F-type H+-transporting ATPase subunit b
MLEFGPTLFIQIVNFVFLLLILKAFLWKPLMETLEKRQKHIESQIKEAEGINEEARDLKARYEEQLAKAREEAQKIIREASQQAESLKEQIINEAKEEAARIRRQAELDAEAEKGKAMLEVKRYMADLVVSAAAKILEDSLDKATQERLMMEFVRKVPETN